MSSLPSPSSSFLGHRVGSSDVIDETSLNAAFCSSYASCHETPENFGQGLLRWFGRVRLELLAVAYQSLVDGCRHLGLPHVGVLNLLVLLLHVRHLLHHHLLLSPTRRQLFLQAD